MGRIEIEKCNYFFDNWFTTFSYYAKDDSLYCITHEGSFLRIDCQNFEAEFLAPKIIGEEFTGFTSTDNIIAFNKVFFFEYNGARFLVYDIANNEIRIMELPEVIPASVYSTRSNILSLSIVDNYIYCVVRNMNTIFMIDPISNEIVSNNKLKYSLENAWAIKFKECDYLLFEGDRYVKKFRTDLNEDDKLDIGTQYTGIMDVASDQEYVFILLNDGNVVRTDFENENKIFVLGGEKNEFARLVVVGKKIWIFPCIGEDIYYIEDKNVYKYEDYDENFKYGATPEFFRNGSKYTNSLKTPHGIVFPAKVGNMLAIISQNSELIWENIHYPEVCKKLEALVKVQGFVIEKKDYKTLQNFIKAL